MILKLLGNYPFIRGVESPLTKHQLRPLDERCETVQFWSPLAEKEYPILAKFLRDYPEVQLRAYGHYEMDVPDLSFLKYFAGLRKLSVEIYRLQSVKGIETVSEDLQSLSFGQTKKRISLRFINDCPNLRALYIEGHEKGSESIAGLQKLEKLTLRSVTLPNLEIIKDLETLWWFALKLGGTTNLSILSQKKKLKYLEIWRVRGFSDLEFLRYMTGLQFLFLEDLPHILEFPDLSRLPHLRRMHIESLKGVNNLNTLSTAQSLEELCLLSMKQLRHDDFIPLLNHPTLKKLLVTTGSLKRDAEIMKFLGLQSTGYIKDKYFS